MGGHLGCFLFPAVISDAQGTSLSTPLGQNEDAELQICARRFPFNQQEMRMSLYSTPPSILVIIQFKIFCHLMGVERVAHC